MIWMVEFIGSLEPVWIPHHSIQHSWIFNEKTMPKWLDLHFWASYSNRSAAFLPIEIARNLGYPTILKPDFWQPCSPPHFHRHWSPFCMGPRMEFHRRLSGYTSDSGDCQLRGWINWINWLSTWKPLETNHGLSTTISKIQVMFLIHVDFVQSHRWAAEPSELGFRETALAHDGAVLPRVHPRNHWDLKRWTAGTEN